MTKFKLEARYVQHDVDTFMFIFLLKNSFDRMPKMFMTPVNKKEKIFFRKTKVT